MKVIKSRRKSIAITLDKDWEVLVKAPYLTSKNTILTFLEKHKSWIFKRQTEIKSSKKKYVSWELLYFLGEWYSIIYDEKIKKITFDWKNFIIPDSFTYNEIKKWLENFYKKEAKIYIEKRLVFIANINNLDFNSFRITSAKSRWGSCSTRKNLNFVFRLIMASPSVIDYVIVHELAHLKEMNHSKNFWDLVDIISKKIWIEDYKKEKKWLKDNWMKISYI